MLKRRDQYMALVAAKNTIRKVCFNFSTRKYCSKRENWAPSEGDGHIYWHHKRLCLINYPSDSITHRGDNISKHRLLKIVLNIAVADQWCHKTVYRLQTNPLSSYIDLCFHTHLPSLPDKLTKQCLSVNLREILTAVSLVFLVVRLQHP